MKTNCTSKIEVRENDDEQHEVVVVSTTKKLTQESPEALVAVEVTSNK